MGCVCEYCHRWVGDDTARIEGWEVRFSCYICAGCYARGQSEHGEDMLYVVEGGEYANGRPDPREGLVWRELLATRRAITP